MEFKSRHLFYFHWNYYVLWNPIIKEMWRQRKHRAFGLLSYVEDDVQHLMLISNLLSYGRENLLPELERHRVERKDLRKRNKHLQRC
mgnify:CR=1 FL=1